MVAAARAVAMSATIILATIFSDHRFLRNRLFLNGWGWGDWGWGPYDNSGSGNTTVVAFPLATPQVANRLSCRYAVSLECGNIHRALVNGRNRASPGRELPLNLSAWSGAGMGAQIDRSPCCGRIPAEQPLFCFTSRTLSYFALHTGRSATKVE